MVTSGPGVRGCSWVLKNTRIQILPQDEIPTHSHIPNMKTIIYGAVMGRSFIYFSLDVKQQLLTLVVSKVNEWLLFNANSAILGLFHGENMLICNEMMMTSALY